MIVYRRVCQQGAVSIAELESHRITCKYAIPVQFLLNHFIAVRIGNETLFYQIWGMRVGRRIDKQS